MNGSRKLALISGVIALALVVGLQSGSPQQVGPTETKGVTAKQLATLDLGPEIQGMAGRILRVRLVTIEPGGVLAVHDHKDRPTIDYVLQGTVIDHRGNEAKEYGPGSIITETKETVHWVENKGTSPAAALSADILKQP